MKKIILLLLTIPLISLCQSAKDLGCMSIPKTLDENLRLSYIQEIENGNIYINDIIDDLKNSGEYSLNDKPWAVFSDRDDNVIYEMANYDRPSTKKLEIGQKVYIMDVDRNWVKVGIDELVGRKYIVQELGWIEVSNILLNQKSLRGEKKFILQRSIILPSIDEINPRSDDWQRYITDKKFYGIPGFDPSYDQSIGNVPGELDIFFKLKEIDGRILLAKYDKINDKNDILGWISKAATTDWNHRLCLEANTNPDVIKKYGDKKAYVINTYGNLKNKYQEQGGLYDADYVIREIKMKNERWKADRMRMLILPKDNNEFEKNIKRVATIAFLQAEEGAEEKVNQLKRELKKMANEVSNVNILFVLDATGSLNKYKDDIATSIQNITTKINLDFKESNVKFGLSVYRSYQDKEIYQKAEFKNASEIIKDLNNISFKSKGKYHWEAHYYGLYNAINDAFDENTENESNIVVLIGDAGDLSRCEDCDKSFITNEFKINGQFITAETIAKKIHDLKLSYVGYQVNVSESSPYAYYDYQDNLYTYLENSADSKNMDWDSDYIETNDGTTEVWLNFKKSDSNTDFLDPMFARYKFPEDEGSKLNEEDLLQHVTLTINEYMERKKQEVDVLQEELTKWGQKGGNRTGGDGDEDIYIDYLLNKGWTQDDIDALRDAGQVSAKGWINMGYHGINSSRYPAFSKVVFVEKDFKNNYLDEIFEALSAGDMASPIKARENFYTALHQICKAFLGESSSNVIDNMSLGQIWEDVLGVKFSGRLGKKLIKEIKTMDDNEFASFYGPFRKSAIRWNSNRSSMNDEYTLWKKSLSNEYYWIPLNQFPGCESAK